MPPRLKSHDTNLMLAPRRSPVVSVAATRIRWSLYKYIFLPLGDTSYITLFLSFTKSICNASLY